MLSFFFKKNTPKKEVQNDGVICLEINSLDAFGQGVAFHQNKTIFVENALPGELVEVVLTESKAQYAFAKVAKHINKSSERMDAACSHFGSCGGCRQQHVSPNLQCESKLNAFRRLMERETGYKIERIGTIKSDSYHYRRRTRLGLQYLPMERQLVLGYRKPGSNDLIKISECPVLCRELESLLDPVRLALSQLKRANKLGHIELILADNGPVLVIRHVAPLPDEDILIIRRLAEQYEMTVYLLGNEWQGMLLGHQPYYQLGDICLSFEPSSFIQINREVNEKMVELACQWLDLQSTDRVLDLFCGIGNFSLPMAKVAAEVVGLEGVAESIEQASFNATMNDITNAAFYHYDLNNDFTHEPWVGNGFNKILLDPSRNGANSIMPALIKLRAERIVYVSCNPATLARDSKELLKSGYRLMALNVLDMFPHTEHIESMALFMRE